MQIQDSTLGKWIRDNFDSQIDFAVVVGTNPTQVSRWVGGAGISSAYQKKIRKVKYKGRDLEYKGPWPADEAKDRAAGGPAPFATREEYAVLKDRVETLRGDLDKEKALRFALRGAVRQLAKAAGLNQILEQIE